MVQRGFAWWRRGVRRRPCRARLIGAYLDCRGASRGEIRGYEPMNRFAASVDAHATSPPIPSPETGMPMRRIPLNMLISWDIESSWLRFAQSVSRNLSGRSSVLFFSPWLAAHGLGFGAAALRIAGLSSRFWWTACSTRRTTLRSGACNGRRRWSVAASPLSWCRRPETLQKHKGEIAKGTPRRGADVYWRRARVKMEALARHR